MFKSGKQHFFFTNYRPVSLLPQFSKILEKLYCNRLDKFIEKHKLLDDSQYGFRENRSTALALLDSVEEITNCVDEGKLVAGLFIDLKKAFDTINHNILINKLEKYGIRGIALQWIRSYLKNRKQFVKIENFCSSCLKINCGIPQGAVLGPELFILYINDLSKVSKALKSVLFADDTNVFFASYNLKELVSMIEIEMGKLNNWFAQNRLSLNLDKTKIMFFGNLKENEEANLKIQGISIERIKEIKFLGVIIDEKLTWKSHIKHIQNKISKSIAILYRVKHILDRESLHTLYCSMVLPYFSYCSEVWGNNYKTRIDSLITLQKRAIRIINKAGYRDHTNPLFIIFNQKY